MTRWNKMLMLAAACPLLVMACQMDAKLEENDANQVAASVRAEKPTPGFISTSDNPHLGSASHGKPATPVDIRYRILEQAIVGQPLTVKFRFITPTNRPAARIDYRSADSSALIVIDSNSLDASLSTDNGDSPIAHSVQVIPQVEGRSYFVVSVTVDSAEGMTTKHTSIPIQVGTGGPKLEMNGELVTAEDGSLVISMPAKEN